MSRDNSGLLFLGIAGVAAIAFVFLNKSQSDFLSIIKQNTKPTEPTTSLNVLTPTKPVSSTTATPASQAQQPPQTITLTLPTSYQHAGETGQTFQAMVQQAVYTSVATGEPIPVRQPAGTPVGVDYIKFWDFQPQFDASGQLIGYVAL